MNLTLLLFRYTRVEQDNRQDVSRIYLRNLVSAVSFAKVLFEKLNSSLSGVAWHENFFYTLGKQQLPVFLRYDTATKYENIVNFLFF